MSSLIESSDNFQLEHMHTEKEKKIQSVQTWYTFQIYKRKDFCKKVQIQKQKSFLHRSNGKKNFFFVIFCTHGKSWVVGMLFNRKISKQYAQVIEQL